jgi:hypothetical protein
MVLLAACGAQGSGAEDPPVTLAAADAELASSGEAWLPGTSEVQDAIGAICPAIRKVTCQGFEEEPTEFSCTFEQAQPDGSWSERAAVVAIDGDDWINISGTGCGAMPEEEFS